MKVRKVTGFILMLVMLFSLCACVNKVSDEDDVAAVIEKESEQNENTTVQENQGEKETDVIEQFKQEAEIPEDSKVTDLYGDGTVIAVESTQTVDLTPDQIKDRVELLFIGEYTGNTSLVQPDVDFIANRFTCEPVYTNYEFKALKVTKGNINGDTVTIREAGGTIGEVTCQPLYPLPEFQKGKKYLVYAMPREDIVAGDITTYNIYSTSCFEIGEDGNLIFHVDLTDKEKQQFAAHYDAIK